MSFADSWKKAGEPVDEFDPPDGPYQVRVIDGGAFTGNDGRQWAKITLEVTTGEHTGRSFVDFMNLNNEVGLRIARENLSLYGLNADDITELEDLDTAILELTGTTADVTVKHSTAGFLNVTVSRTLTGQSDVPDGQEKFDTSDMQPARAGSPYTDPDEDEIPF